MIENRWQYTCLTCGYGGAGDANQQYDCGRCKTTLKMHRSSNKSPYPIVHDGFFNKDCGCEQCSVFWRKDNTVSTSWVHDECTLTGKHASEVFDIFAASDPAAVLVANQVLGWGDTTLTLVQWAQRIRDLGGNFLTYRPVNRLEVGFPIPPELEELANKLEHLGNGTPD